MEKGFKIGFYGGIGGPTGSHFLCSDEKEETKLLIDCGLTQGGKFCDDVNREKFPYDIKKIGHLVVTHAHIDHIGRIPKLVKDGFRGEIISTAPTREIAELMLSDSLGVLEKEASREGKPAIYEQKDVDEAIRLWKTVPYHEKIKIGNFSIALFDAGHILGSAMIDISYEGKRLLFSGDLGNSPAPLLNDAESIEGIYALVIESVYGDRIHEDRNERKDLLEDVIEDSVRRGGALMIPAFSLERTQELLSEINDLVEEGRVPSVPIFIDSPLAIDVTKIYKKYESFFNKNTKHKIKKGDDIFNFPNLHFTYKAEESKDIIKVQNPKIIIAGSGMSNGGRIVHHEKAYLPDPDSTLLIIGYQVPGSLGRKLQDGEKEVEIFGERVPVKAQVRTIHGYSAHKDSDALLEFVANAGDSLKFVYSVLGEPKARLYLVQRIRDYLGIKAFAPQDKEEITIPV